jgi:hypothetical protein
LAIAYRLSPHIFTGRITMNMFDTGAAASGQNLTLGSHIQGAVYDPKRAFRLLAWISRLDQDLPGGQWSDLNDWSQVSGVMVADHRPARASAIVAATIGASYLGMVAQIVTKQKTVLPPGIVSLQNMEVVCP